MSLFSNNFHKLLLVILALGLPGLLFPIALLAQTKKKPVKKNTTKTVVTEPTPKPAETPVVTTDEPTKKNTRDTDPVKTNLSNKPAAPVGTQYSYTFDRPGFPYSHIVIEHDDSGKGRIWMTPKDETEALDDPIELSSLTMSNLKKAFDALNFLNSVESYQYSRDYSHLGNITITIMKEKVSRTAKFNWTENSNAKALMDEYRRISNEYTWKLEMESARANQPLLTPGLIEAFASYIDRSEISDPGHLMSYLTALSLDERLPLLARNRVKKVIVKIAKDAK